MTRHEMLFRESSATLERRDVSARPQSYNETEHTIEAVLCSDAPVTRRDQRGDFDEILDPAGLDLEAVRGVSVLDAHSQQGVASILGTVVRAWREGSQIVALLRLSERADAAFLADVRSGVVQHLSVGYVVHEWRDGENGGRRTRTAAKWEIKEASFVPVPADRNARTRQHETSALAACNQAIIALGRQCGAPQAVVDGLLIRGASLDQARAAMLDHMITRGGVHIRTAEHRTLDNPVEFVRAGGEALFTVVNRRHTPSGPARQLGFTTIADAARECLRRSGEHLMTTAPAVVITRALHTTSDFPLLLGDTVGRVLRASYEAVPSALRRLARQVSAPDFRERASLVLDAGGFKLEKVNEHGEFKSGAFVESGEKYKLATYGKIFGITRQALVNDDLGALTDVPTKLGQQAAAFEAQYLVDLLESGNGLGPTFSDGKTLFHADHGNVAEVAVEGAPDSTSLTKARLAMRKQTGPGGELINVVPRSLLVPAELETAAQTLLSEITPSTIEDVSIWSSLLDLIVEPRLSDPARWYLVADPAASGLEVAYLSGNEGPQTETQAGFRIDGVETKVRLDFVAAFVDWRGIYSNEGTAGP